MEDIFNLKDIKCMFDFIFRLYNLVSLANDNSHNLNDPADKVTKVHLAVKDMGLGTLTGIKRKPKSPGDGNAARKKQKTGEEEPGDNDILSDSAMLEALTCAGYTITRDAENFKSLLPVRAHFPWKGQH